MFDLTAIHGYDSFFSTRNAQLEASSLARLEVALTRWSLAQELRCWVYPEQHEDAQLLELCFGELPEEIPNLSFIPGKGGLSPCV